MVPWKMGLNWFIPELVNKSVASSCGITAEDLIKVWPYFETKKSMNVWRTLDTLQTCEAVAAATAGTDVIAV